jgi:hypothetical protein
MGHFIPDAPPGGVGYKEITVQQACLEDGLAGYTSQRSLKSYQQEIIERLEQAGATNIYFQSGMVDGRRAWLLTFIWGAVPVRIVQVALPTRADTDRARQQAERQALYHLLNELRFELERRHFHPDRPAFVTYMIAPGTDKTVGEIIADADALVLPDASQEMILLESGK